MSLDWSLDKNSNTPLYEQIKQFIIQKITCGEWYLGYRLPTQRELACYFDVNRSTLKSALEDLTADGILDTRGKGGTYVKNNTWSLFNEISSPDWIKYIQSGSMSPNREITHSIHHYEFGTEFIRLSTGELSAALFPKDSIDSVLRSLSISDYNLSYNHQNGLLALRESLVEYYEKIGVFVKPSQILLVAGAIQAIHLISIGLLPKGASVLCELPSYLYSLNLFESTGTSLYGVVSEEDGINIDALNTMYKRTRTPIYYTIPYFQNPTGMRLSDFKRKELMKACQKFRLPIIEDDTYRELYYDGNRPFPLKASDENQSIIHIGSVSKTLCAGLRIGWIIGQEEVINKLADLKMQIDYGTSTLSQLVLNQLLRNGEYEDNLKRLRQSLKLKRDVMLEILDEDFNNIAEWNIPRGGFYIWLKIKLKINIKSIFEYCIQQGVLINPGYMYDKTNGDSIRLSFSYASVDQIKYGLQVLKNAIYSEMKDN